MSTPQVVSRKIGIVKQVSTCLDLLKNYQKKNQILCNFLQNKVYHNNYLCFVIYHCVKNKRREFCNRCNRTYGKSISLVNDVFYLYRIWFLHFLLLHSLRVRLVLPVLFVFYFFIDT